MAKATLDPVLRRDRMVVIASAAAVTILAWMHLLRLAASMHAGMSRPEPMSGMGASGMDGMMMPSLGAWSPQEGVIVFAMWAVMMVGMMLPSVTPMLVIHARVARQALAQGKPFAATGWFALGYLLAWAGFSLGATAAQWGLERTLLLSPAMVGRSHVFGGLVLIAAGLYQWTPFKEACLSQCQAPLVFIQRHGGFRRDAVGSMRLGVRHGLYCIGCCWALMALLFVGGVMNVLWIAAISVFILLEKLVPSPRLLSRVAGTGLLVVGAWMLR